MYKELEIEIEIEIEIVRAETHRRLIGDTSPTD